MKTQAKTQYFTQVAKLGRHNALVALIAASALLPASALATVSLKQVQVTSSGARAETAPGVQVDLLFDGKISKDQVRIEFFNDIIQIVLTDVSVYPAKISTVNSGKLMKIFAYQYAPKVVRCRLTVKGKAETFSKDFRDRLQLSSSGKLLTVRLDGADSDRISFQAAHASQARSAEGKGQVDPEERALMERVMHGTPAEDKTEGRKPAEREKTSAPAKTVGDSISSSSSSPVSPTAVENGSGRLAGGKPLASPMKALGKLALVLAFFGGLAFVARKLLLKAGGTRSAGMVGAINRFARRSLGGKAKMIEVVSTHYLGPKKSIAVVKVAGRTLVLGVSNESINLITQIEGDGSELDLEELAMESAHKAPRMAPGANSRGFAAPARGPATGGGIGAGAIAAGTPAFSDLLFAENGKPRMDAGPNGQREVYSRAAKIPGYGSGAVTPGRPRSQTLAQTVAQPQAPAGGGVRSMIRSKLEGLKPL